MDSTSSRDRGPEGRASRNHQMKLGFAVKVLWWVAILALALWVIGFFVAGAERRWYHW